MSSDDLARLWAPFGLRVTCGPLVLRPLRDADLPELVELVQGGVHPPDEMPFLTPWTEVPPAELALGALQSQWRQRADLSPDSWSLNLGVWHEDRLVGSQGVRTREFPITRTGTTSSWLGLAFQRQGIGTLMRQAVCVLCFDHLGFEELTSGALVDNPSSMAVSRKVGYRPNGEQRSVRRGEVVRDLSFVLRPDELVRPPYDVEVVGAEAFLELVQARAT